MDISAWFLSLGLPTSVKQGPYLDICSCVAGPEISRRLWTGTLPCLEQPATQP